MKDSWRYKLVPDFVLDKHLAYNPEDEWISRIDGDYKEDVVLDWTYHEFIDEMLDKREARIVDIGNDYGFSKQRAHFLYKRACEKIRRALDGKENT